MYPSEFLLILVFKDMSIYNYYRAKKINHVGNISYKQYPQISHIIKSSGCKWQNIHASCYNINTITNIGH